MSSSTPNQISMDEIRELARRVEAEVTEAGFVDRINFQAWANVTINDTHVGPRIVVNLATGHVAGRESHEYSGVFEATTGEPRYGRLRHAYNCSAVGGVVIFEHERYGAACKAFESESKKLQLQNYKSNLVVQWMAARYLEYGGDQSDQAYENMVGRQAAILQQPRERRGRNGMTIEEYVQDRRAWWRVAQDGELVGYREVPLKVGGMRSRCDTKETCVAKERRKYNEWKSKVAEAMKQVQILEANVDIGVRQPLSAVPYRVQKQLLSELSRPRIG